jgi:hypothetical protein
MELLRDLVPHATTVAVLSDSNYAAIEGELAGIEAAGHALGRKVVPRSLICVNRSSTVVS